MREKARSDQQLVNQARKGDANAFRVLVEKYQKRALAVAIGIVRDSDDAHDLCQEAFLRAYRGLDKFDGDSQFYTWFYRILSNLAIDHLRRRKFQAVSLDDPDHAPTLADDAPDPEHMMARRKLCDRLDAALATLSPVQRAVLTLREVQGLSYQEISDVVGCSLGTVMSRLFHARKNLVKALKEEDAAAFDEDLAA
jgi:RNA polymerase sigma-70 factor, ECF subfamily